MPTRMEAPWQLGPALIFLHSQPFEPGRVRLKYLLNEWGQLQPTEVRWPAQGCSSWQKWHEKPVLPGGTSGKEPACHCRRHKRRGFDPWVRKKPWRRAWQPVPVFSPGKPQGQRSLEGYSPKADTTKASWHTRTHPGSAKNSNGKVPPCLQKPLSVRSWASCWAGLWMWPGWKFSPHLALNKAALTAAAAAGPDSRAHTQPMTF